LDFGYVPVNGIRAISGCFGGYRPDAEYAALIVIGHLSVTSETVDPMKIVKRIQTMLHCHIEI